MRAWAVLLAHDHPEPHLDLIIAHGRRCPTLRIDARGATWAAPHRRHYLTYRGPVPGGRGRVAPVWRGWVVVTAREVRPCDAPVRR